MVQPDGLPLRALAAILALLCASPALAQDTPGEWDSPVVLAGPLSTSGLLNLSGLTCTPSLVCYPDSDSWNCTDGAGATVAVTQGTSTGFEATPFTPGPSGTVARYAARITSDAKRPKLTTPSAYESFWTADHTVIVVSQAGPLGGIALGQGASGADGFYLQRSGTSTICAWSGAALAITRPLTYAPATTSVVSCSKSGTTYVGRHNGNINSSATAGTIVAPTGDDFFFGGYVTAGNYLNGTLGPVALFPCVLTATELTRIESAWSGTIAESRNVPVDRNSTAGWVAPDGVRYALGDDMGRVDARGLLVEEARTNRLTYSRDFSNAAWTKVNLTGALSQVGLDGVANSASLLTATAANGTAIQSIAGLASAARINTVYLKRGSGTGTVEITSDNGGAWTPVVLTGAYQRFEISRSANTAIDFGVRIVTSGDTVIADFAQAEEGVDETQAVGTTTAAAARLADKPLSLATGYPTGQGEYCITTTPEWTTPAADAYLFDTRTGTNGIECHADSSARLNCATGNAGAATTVQSAALTWAAGDVFCLRWGGGNIFATQNATVRASAVAGTANMPTAHAASAAIGSTVAGASQFNGWLRSKRVSQ